jgi:hypothetical protein
MRQLCRDDDWNCHTCTSIKFNIQKWLTGSEPRQIWGMAFVAMQGFRMAGWN